MFSSSPKRYTATTRNEGRHQQVRKPPGYTHGQEGVVQQAIRQKVCVPPNPGRNQQKKNPNTKGNVYSEERNSKNAVYRSDPPNVAEGIKNRTIGRTSDTEGTNVQQKFHPK
jgi:hypothetical protein